MDSTSDRQILAVEVSAMQKVREALEKLLLEKGISGYSIRGNKVVIYVEDEESALQFKSIAFEGYETEVKVIGRLQML
jgi:hypothetical protein